MSATAATISGPASAAIRFNGGASGCRFLRRRNGRYRRTFRLSPGPGQVRLRRQRFHAHVKNSMYLCSGQALSARSMPGRPQPRGNKEAAADVWPCRVNGSGGGAVCCRRCVFVDDA